MSHRASPSWSVQLFSFYQISTNLNTGFKFHLVSICILYTKTWKKWIDEFIVSLG